jgi:maltooligosyltrehalose trehalohydrolase
MQVSTSRRRLTAGVELQKDGGAHARVWAPKCRRVELVVDEGAAHPLDRAGDGYFEAHIPDVGPGARYWYRLDGDRLRPDPVSRFQPDGPHGPSMIVDPSAFRWTDQSWNGIDPQGQVLYEMHVGTFTPEGTWAGAMARLGSLQDLGITVIELMPVADFAGKFGWGYDGVNLYAPTRLYGTPDDLRTFIDRAHALGLGVILDVVYNHLGPDGNYLGDFSDEYFTDRYKNDWGRAINFETSPPARAFFVENAGYWIDEFHFDGLRLDATQDIKDAGKEHVIASMARRAREAGGARRVYLIAENEPQDSTLVRAQKDGGHGLDGLWNDDFHHSAVVALTGRREAYYTDYAGGVQELISCAKYGYLYQGQWYAWQKKRRGTPSLDLPPHTFISYLENHDQIANSALGRRAHHVSAPGRFRAMTALMLLGPATPMLFQGQEFSSSAPFLYFADHGGELRESIRKGRYEFLLQFDSVRDPEVSPLLAPPDAEETFQRCKLNWDERSRRTRAFALHRDLLHLRHRTRAITHPVRVDGAVLAPEAMALRFFSAEGDLLLVVNLGCDLDLSPSPEPLLGPPKDSEWVLLWSSESVKYGGHGTAPVNPDAQWRLPGEAALLFGPAPATDESDERRDAKD